VERPRKKEKKRKKISHGSRTLIIAHLIINIPTAGTKGQGFCKFADTNK
jgi:hypothetical protein